jgi:hypothetical protein
MFVMYITVHQHICTISKCFHIVQYNLFTEELKREGIPAALYKLST